MFGSSNLVAFSSFRRSIRDSADASNPAPIKRGALVRHLRAQYNGQRTKSDLPGRHGRRVHVIDQGKHEVLQHCVPQAASDSVL
jgi:hypothetical protein